MKKINNVFVQKINSWYVSDDCVHVMVPYQKYLTIFDKNGIHYHHHRDSEDFIDKYIYDERRKQFPYYNIPTHYKKIPFIGKCIFVNQLLEYETPYLEIKDGSIIETFVVKNNNEALVLNKCISFDKKSEIKTRGEMEKIFEIPTSSNEKIYFLDGEGNYIVNTQLKLPTELEILKYYKELLAKNVQEFKEYRDNYPATTIGQYLNANKLFLEFVEKNIHTLDLKNYELPTELLPGNLKGDSIFMIKTNGIDINLSVIKVFFMTTDKYKIETYEFPITKYSLEQIKTLTTKIIKTKEPKINLKHNLSLTPEDIQRENQLIKNLKNK